MPVRNYGEEELENLREVLASGRLSVLSGGKMQPRFEKAFARAHGAKYGVAMNCAMSVLHAAEGQMRVEGPPLALEAQPLEAPLEARLKPLDVAARVLDAGPHHPRGAPGREGAETRHIDLEGRGGLGRVCHRLGHGLYGRRVDLAQELQCDVHLLSPRPPDLAAGLAQPLLRLHQQATNRVVELDGDERPHAHAPRAAASRRKPRRAPRCRRGSPRGGDRR